MSGGFEKQIARALDFGMCAAMNAVQLRHRLHASSRTELESYIAQCEPMSREEFFHVPPAHCHPERSFAEQNAVEGAVILSAVEGPLIFSGQRAPQEQTEFRGPSTAPLRGC